MNPKTVLLMTAVALPVSASFADSLGALSMQFKNRRAGLVENGVRFQAESVDGAINTTAIAGEARFRTARRTGAASGLSGVISTFSLEMGQPSPFAWHSYEVRSLLDAPSPDSVGGSTIGAEVQHRIHAVVRAAIEEGVIDARMRPTGASSETGLAAVQLALWEAAWERSGSLSLSDGTALLTDAGLNRESLLGDALSGILARANAYLTLNRSDFEGFKVDGLAVLTSESGPDQLAIVPLPPAAFAGFGLLGAVGVARRFRKA